MTIGDIESSGIILYFIAKFFKKLLNSVKNLLIWIFDSKFILVFCSLFICNLNIFWSFDIKLQLYPIFTAVFILSPVKTQNFILANLNFCIVSGTSSCNLSSTIVAPNNSKCLSIFSYDCSIIFVLFPSFKSSKWNFSFHFIYSPLLISL